MHDNLFPVINAGGSPYDIGYIHGSKAKEQLEVSINTYQAMFEDFSGITWQKAKKLAGKYIDIIHNFDKNLIDEMQGVADGAEKSFEDILALNTRSELVLSGKYLNGCTSLALGPDVTTNGDTIIGQNWDWKESQKEAFIILNIEQKDKPNVVLITEAGIIGKLGFNSSGLGVCLNALASDLKPDGVPLHIVLRSILNSRTISEAIKVVGSPGVACSANFLIGHKEGEVVTIEANAKDYDVIYGDEGFVVHTNHFTSLRLANSKDIGKLVFPDSFVRLGRARKLIKKLKGNIDTNSLKIIFSDHIEYPDSICRHENFYDEPGRRMETVFSLIINLSKMEMYIAPGTPCSFEYKKYSNLI